METWTIRVNMKEIDIVNLMDRIGELIDQSYRVPLHEIGSYLGVSIGTKYQGCYFTSFEDIEYEKVGPDLFDIVIKNLEVGSQKEDMVNHPPHYQSKAGLEVIDVIAAFTDGLNGIEATDTGNILKYACRWKKKNGVQDLEKIVWYANHLINYLKEGENK